MQGAAAPRIDANTVYYGTTAGDVVALDLHSGKPLRRWSLPNSGGRFNSVVGELALTSPNTLVFATASGMVAAIDPRNNDNKLQWQRNFTAITTSVCRETVCYLGLANGALAAINVTDGTIIWHRSLGWSPASITPHRQHLYVSGSDGFVVKLHTTHGHRVWQEHLGNSIFAPPYYSSWYDFL